jgi:hypothetical protein
MGTHTPGKLILFCLLLFLSTPVWTQMQDTVIIEEKDIVEENDSYDEDDDEREYFDQKPIEGIQEDIKLRKVPSDQVKKMKEDKAFWYADAVFEKEKLTIADETERYVPLGQRAWFQTLLWFVIIGGFAVFLMLYLSSSKVGLFRKKDKTLEEIQEEEKETGDIFAINYQKEIERAVAQGNYRLAVRLMYLRLLKIMSERNIIRYTQDKTNFDYLLQLHPTPYYKDFFRITRHYEYSWYGQFDVSEDNYKIIRQDVDHFERELK